MANIDEMELVNLSEISIQISISSTLSSISSCSTPVPSNVFPIFPPQSSPMTFTFPPAFRWLLPPSYDPTSVTWPTNNNTSTTTNTSQTVILSSSFAVEQMDVKSLGKSLFQDMTEDIYDDDAEFLDVLEQ